MRKKMLAILALTSSVAAAQDTLKTTNLQEVVVTGTKFDLPVEKSGKTIFKLTSEDIEQNAGKMLGDLLNEVPGLQIDGNFGTPGSNVSYYLRGARNKQTLVLIDGVPLNDPSGINAEYDLRYIPTSQIESIEVLKGGLSTLYGTNASAGVINITLKSPTADLSGMVDVNAGSYNTYSQNAQVSGTTGKLSYLVSGSNVASEGFSAAYAADPVTAYDKDGFSRQNGLLKLGWNTSDKFKIGFQTAYEQFDADYDDYEFVDADNSQKYQQMRIGITPEYNYSNGSVEGKIFFNRNERHFYSNFPGDYEGKNFQGELINRHRFNKVFQSLMGLNVQRLSFDQSEAINSDSSNFQMIDPYASVFVDLPVGLNIHAGARINTHSVYGSRFVYNLNPSFTFNREGAWNYKIFASLATSYVTPSLYQLYSEYGNKELDPEESFNTEAGISVYHAAFTLNVSWFNRDENNPIDFVTLFDNEGNYIGGQYRNVARERNVKGWELDVQYNVNEWINISGNVSLLDTDMPQSFYRIPKEKFGLNLSIQPITRASFSLKYNFTGERTYFNFISFSEQTLDSYQLIDLFVSYQLLKKANLTLYGAINNIFDEEFIGVVGYTTRGRNWNAGIRYSF